MENQMTYDSYRDYEMDYCYWDEKYQRFVCLLFSDHGTHVSYKQILDANCLEISRQLFSSYVLQAVLSGEPITSYQWESWADKVNGE